jgi:hypothetical protein
MQLRWRTGRLAGLTAALVLGAGLGGLAGPGAASAAGCQPYNGTPPVSPVGGTGTDILHAVAVAGPCDMWMVGFDGGSDQGSGQTLIEHWAGGGSWTVTPSPSPGQPFQAGDQGDQLAAVSAVSATDVWAVGFEATSAVNQALALHWNGSTWAQVPLPGGTKSLNAVTALAGNNVWAAGTDRAGGALVLHYDGSSWSRSPVPPLDTTGGGTQSAGLAGLSATSASDVWAVGEQNTTGNGGIPLTLHWDGSAWSQVPTPSAARPDGKPIAALNSVSASSPADAWAVGTSLGSSPSAATVIMHWDGRAWTQVPSPDPGATFNFLNGVTAISATSAIAVGGYSNGGLRPMMLRWNGSSWTQVTVPNPNNQAGQLFGVAAGPAGVWTAGDVTDPATGAFRAIGYVFGVVPSVFRDTPDEAAGVMASAGLAVTFSTTNNGNPACNGLTNGKIVQTFPGTFSFTAPPVNLVECNV